MSHLSPSAVAVFRKQFPRVPLWVASLEDRHARQLDNSVEVLPWREAIRRYQNLRMGRTGDRDRRMPPSRHASGKTDETR